MVDTTVEREAQGLTREEWLEQQRNIQNSALAELSELNAVIGLDIANGEAGIQLSDFNVIVGRVEFPTAPEITEHTNDIPGMYGVNYQGMSYGRRVFEIPLSIVADSQDAYNRSLQSLANLLITPDTADEQTIVFGQRPNVQYRGHFSKVPKFEFAGNNTYIATANLEFTASDPRGFLIVDGPAAPNDLVEVTDTNFSFIPLGSGKADPIIHLTALEGANDITRIGYRVGDDSRAGVMVGMSANTAKAFDTHPVIFADTMADSTRWLPSTRTDISNAKPSDGTIEVNDTGGALTVGKWASDTKKYQNVGDWFGPLVISKNGFGATLGSKSWEASITLRHQSKGYSRAASGVYAYLLDAAGNRRAFVGIRDRENGGRPMALIRFGKNGTEEAKALATGLGTKTLNGKNGKNKKDRTIKLSTAAVHKIYQSDKVTERRDYFWYGSSYKHKWHTRTSITEYDASLKKYRTSSSWSPTGVSSSAKSTAGGTTLYRKPAGVNGTNTDKNGNPVVGDVQYWEKGDYKRAGDLVNGAIDKKKKYTKRTAKRVKIQNKVTREITETNNQVNGKTISTVLVYTYVNGSDLTNKKWGVLIDITKKNDATKDADNHDTSSVYADKTIGVVDLGQSSSLDNALIKFVIGHTSKGFYYSIVQLDPKTGRQKYVLLPKTYDKKPSLHGSYDFQPDKIAMHMFTQVLQEDVINPETKKPIKSYNKNYVAAVDMKVTKLLPAISGADLITLKPGQTMTIDTPQLKVFVDGLEVQPDWAVSSFPQLQGGVENKLTFTHPPEKIKAVVEYRPTDN